MLDGVQQHLPKGGRDIVFFGFGQITDFAEKLQ
jgi:hypothetical protein